MRLSAIETPGARPTPMRHSVVAVLAVLLVQGVLQATFFPLNEVLGAKPLYTIDSAFHQYQMETALQLCRQHRLLGYDPFFAAGYLGGVTFNASAKLQALVSCAVGNSAAIAAIYKVVSFLFGLVAPALLVVAAALIRLGGGAIWGAAAFALLSWWTGPMRWYHTAGLVSYVFVAYAVPAFAAGVSRTCEAPNLPRIGALAVTAAFGTLIHPLFVVAAVLVCAPLLVGDLERHGGWRTVIGVSFACAAVVLALNGVWLQAALSAPNFATVEQPYQRLVDPWLVLREPLGRAATAAGGSRLYLAVLVGTGAALALARGPTQRRMLALISAGMLTMLWASFGGLHKGIAALQPNRFSALAWLVLSLPACWGIAESVHTWRSSGIAGRVWRGAVLITVAALGLYFARDTAYEAMTARSARYGTPPPEVKGEGRLSRELVLWLQGHTDTSARIFFETSLGRIHDGAHMAGIYALQTGREFIGGPYPHTDFASAWDDWAFGRTLHDIPPAELEGFLNLYNVRWMLCHTSPCRKAMEALPGTASVAEMGPVTAFERRSAPGYFIVGKGTIRSRCFNRIEVEVDDAPGDALVLSYHWLPGLVAEPPIALGSRHIGADPRPFVTVDHPPRRFALGVGRPAAPCAKTDRP